jgi:hypothetical protein
MKGIHGLYALVMVAGVAFASTATDAPANERMFARMSGLVGDWDGTFEWSGARKASGSLGATYSLTGNGSALLETLIMGGTPSMTTVYHLDGPDLRMTHFCAARNQPRLKATRIDVDGGGIDFGFVDVTNAGPSNPAYVQAFEMRMLDPDRVHLKFVFGAGEKQAIEDISLHRVKKS